MKTLTAFFSHFPEAPVLPLEPVIVQSLSRVRLCATLWIAACQASLSITVSRGWLKLTSIESVMLSNHLILCPLLFLPSIFPSVRDQTCMQTWSLTLPWSPTLVSTYYSPPGSSVPGTLQARILEWAAISFSRGSS